MRVFVLAVAALAVLAASPLATPADEFAFLPPPPCAEVADPELCRVALPRPWTDAEQQAVRAVMQRLRDHELARGVLAGASANGYRAFRRYTTATKLDPTQGRVAMFSPAFVLYRDKVIAITDAFFQTEETRDTIGRYRYGDFIVLHELIHAFDDRARSVDPSFAAAAGWVFRKNRWEYAHPVDPVAYRSTFAATLGLYAQGRPAEAWSRDRSFATALHPALPTLQSLVNPAESFADILAHLILDPAARDYLPPRVVDWFERAVFPDLHSR